MRQLNQISTYLNFIVLFLFCGCTDSFLGDDEISGNNRIVRGKVQLENFNDASGVFVWLEGLQISTKTDQDGNFELFLPASSAVVNESLLELFCYVGNYVPYKESLVVRDGAFVYSENKINSSGSFNEPFFMIKSFDIDVMVRPSRISNRKNAPLNIQVTLSSVHEKAKVFFPFNVDGFRTPLIFKNLDTGEITVRNTTLVGLGSIENVVLSKTEYIRSYVANVASNEFIAGSYEIIPYMLVPDQVVPQELLTSIHPNVEKIGKNYLQLPFKRSGGKFDVYEGADILDINNVAIKYW